MSDPRNHIGAKIGFDAAPQFKALALFKERIERAFFCVQGPQKAYFELRADIADRANTEVTRVVYETVAFVTADPLTEETVHALCEKAWNEVFQPALEKFNAFHDGDDCRDDRVLFWRREPVVGAQNDGFLALRMRCAVPGVQLVSYKRLAAVA